MEAKLTIASATMKQIMAAVVILAGLLSGFFWLGYWTAEINSFGEIPGRVVIEKSQPKNQLTAPTNDRPDAIKELGIRPEDSVRL